MVNFGYRNLTWSLTAGGIVVLLIIDRENLGDTLISRESDKIFTYVI